MEKAELEQNKEMVGCEEEPDRKRRRQGEANTLLEIQRDSSCEEIKTSIIILFHPHIQHMLRMCGIVIARMQQNKKIIRISFDNGSDLETEIGQSKIVVLPLKDFPNDLPILADEDFVPRPSSHTNSILSPTRASILRKRSAVDGAETHGANTTLRERRHSTRTWRQRIEEINEENLDEDDDDHLCLAEEFDPANNFVSFPSLPENAETATIDISRTNCVNELMSLYADEQLLSKNLSVKFIGEIGIDGGGLTKELFNIFFDKCSSTFFQGEDCLVPYLPLNKRSEQDKFITIGRILEHMLILTNSIPAKLSRITLTLIGKSDANIDPTILLQELMNYVNPYLRKILQKGQRNFSSLTEKEQEVIGDFFQSNKFFAKANSETFSEQLQVIATELLVDIPRKLIDKLRQGVQPEKYPDFWGRCDFTVFLDMQVPTPTKVVNCLVTDPYLTNEENEVLHYLIMYINCLDKDNLLKFIFLVTASYQMPNVINIKFNDFVGLSQRPIFTTCTDTLILPKTYVNYNELKNDLNICLHTEEVKEYTSY
ncbi:uncharacterized protein LOC143908460 [Temnothorax americanus]|uniref:uncharacterized protein LOC143908460 n=1 Tax=Temnothorax americanus TaxID=1964332 RepID=UPI00406782B1